MSVPFLPDGCDVGCKMTVTLRQLLRVTTGSVRKVLASLACMSPHSMQTERIVSHHNFVVDNHRTSLKRPPHGGTEGVRPLAYECRAYEIVKWELNKLILCDMSAFEQEDSQVCL